jgi:hypothetical protein
MKWIRMSWSGKVACVGERSDAYRVLVGRARCRWEDSIRLDLREVVWGDMEWFDVSLDRDRWPAVVNVGDFIIR